MLETQKHNCPFEIIETDFSCGETKSDSQLFLYFNYSTYTTFKFYYFSWNATAVVSLSLGIWQVCFTKKILSNPKQIYYFKRKRKNKKNADRKTNDCVQLRMSDKCHPLLFSPKDRESFPNWYSLFFCPFSLCEDLFLKLLISYVPFQTNWCHSHNSWYEYKMCDEFISHHRLDRTY